MGIVGRLFLQFGEFEYAVLPAQRHSGQTTEVIQQRKAVYEAAKAANPKRWSGRTRNWDLPEEVWLNPEKESRSLEAAA
jgi:putative transposase